MGKVNIPILIEKEGIKFKFFYLNFSEDGSVYILFPRKGGYRVKSQKNIPIERSGETRVRLDPIEETFESPYVTFHPRSRSIHINTTDKPSFQYDVPILNMAEEGMTVFPLAQIILSSNSPFLDTYPKEKYPNPLVIQVSKINPKVALSLEVWVHPIDTYIDPKDFPLMSIREAKTRILGIFKLQNQNLKHCTCTIIVSEVSSEGVEERIVVSIPNNSRPYAFDLIAKES